MVNKNELLRKPVVANWFGWPRYDFIVWPGCLVWGLSLVPTSPKGLDPSSTKY